MELILTEDSSSARWNFGDYKDQVRLTFRLGFDANMCTSNEETFWVRAGFRDESLSVGWDGGIAVEVEFGVLTGLD